MIGIVVLFGKLVPFRNPHKPCGLPRIKQAGCCLFPVHHDDRLPAGPSCGRPKAPCNSIKPNLRPLNFQACGVRPRPLVDGSHYLPTQPAHGLDISAMGRGHEGKEPVRLFGVMPFNRRWFIEDQTFQSNFAWLGPRQAPPDPSVTNRTFKVMYRTYQPIRMPWRGRGGSDQA